ncbi:MAG TPA: orotidine 5'-phosphate decarboxylase / HUMPS family protein, partial [Vampirovibrionales bacterium]
LVKLLVSNSYNAGIRNFVCSPHETSIIKKTYSDVTLFTPGIRLKESSNNDQSRVDTPKEALQNGANYLVIGRAITASNNPQESWSKVLQECSTNSSY